MAPQELILEWTSLLLGAGGRETAPCEPRMVDLRSNREGLGGRIV